MSLVHKPAEPPGGVTRAWNGGRCGGGVRRRHTGRQLGWGLWQARPGRLVIFQHRFRLVWPAGTDESLIFALR